MPVSVGDVINYPGTGSGARLSTPHLHVLVSVDVRCGDVHMVPISSERANWDSTREICRTDGVPGVNRDCFAAYYHAKKSSLVGLEAQVQGRICANLGQINPDTYQRLYDGIFASDETEQWFIDELRPPMPRRILSANP